MFHMEHSLRDLPKHVVQSRQKDEVQGLENGVLHRVAEQNDADGVDQDQVAWENIDNTYRFKWGRTPFNNMRYNAFPLKRSTVREWPVKNLKASLIKPIGATTATDHFQLSSQSL